MRVDKLIQQYHEALERLHRARCYRIQFQRAWDRASDYHFSLDLVIGDWMQRDKDNRRIQRKALATYASSCILDGKMWNEVDSAFQDVENAVIDRKKFAKIIEKYIPAFKKAEEEAAKKEEEAKSKVEEEYKKYLYLELRNQDFSIDLLQSELIKSAFLKFLLQEE